MSAGLAPHSTAEPLAASDEYIAQHIARVGHDAVNPEIQEAGHLRCIINGPHMNVHPRPVGTTHESCRHDRDRALAHGHLGGLDSTRRATSHQCGNLSGRTRGAQRRPKPLAQGAKSSPRERTDAYPLEAVRLLQCQCEWFDRIIGLAVNIEASITKGGEKLIKARHLGHTADARGGDLGPRHVRNTARAVACT